MNILLVEPDDVMRALLRSVLEQDGFRVLAVKHNRDALAMATAESVDLVVAQFVDEADVAGSADFLSVLRDSSPGHKLLAISGFRTRPTVLMSMQRVLKPWRTVDLTQGGQVLLDACRDAAGGRLTGMPPVVRHEPSPDSIGS